MRIESTNSSFDLGKSASYNDSPPSFSKERLFNSTALINDYNSSGEKKVFSDNFFKKIKPIMKTWKNTTKLKPKCETKDQATSMD